MRKPRELRLPALEVRQGRNRILYSFAVDGKLLPHFAAVSRIGRDDANRVFGYQRPEVLSHIAEIRAYLESDNPMVPNALVVAFEANVRFERAGKGFGRSSPGTLIIPLPAEGELKPGWIVDGQQRAAALRDAQVKNFPVCVVGFIAADPREQREQFILVNNTKPLPKGLVYELLPSTEARLPSALQRRRFPTILLDRLNLDEDSPLRGLIRTPTRPAGVVKDNSLLRMLENSLSDGALYRFRNKEEGNAGDLPSMLELLKAFWGAVAEVFPNAWKLPPRQSRLLHGAGVVALGFVMDAIAERHQSKKRPKVNHFRSDLEPLKPICQWTDGYWEFSPGTQRKWNELQNTPKDIQMLANYLLTQYKTLVWRRTG
jgi:DGQHR domain-containing protein